MKVLIVHSTNNVISGAEFAIYDMLKSIPEDFTIEILTPGYGILSKFFEDKGFKVYSLKFSGPRRKYPGLYLLSSILFAIWLKRKKIDLVLCNTFAASFRVSLGTKLARKQLIIYVREYFSQTKSVNLKQLQRAYALIVVSKDVFNYCKDKHKKIYVCHDSIDFESIERRIFNKQSPLVNKKYINIGYVGRITSYKQPHIFIKAIPYIISQLPEARFHLVGNANKKEKKYEESLKDLAKDINVINHIIFWGHRNDSVEIISDLDVFCLTSDREPFPRTILESMIVKTPVVCSNTGGCVEIIENKKTGLLFNVNSSEPEKELADAILLILNNNELKKDLIDNAYKKVKYQFGGDTQIINFYNTLRKIKTAIQ